MSAISLLKSVAPKLFSILGTEEIFIGSTKVNAVIDETTSSNALGIGATNNERTMVAKFPSGSFTGTLKSGMTVTARGQSWQISAEMDSIHNGYAAKTITLVEPERRSE